MTSLVDILFDLLKFIGFLEEPPISKNLKRKRVHDETSVQQVKRFCPPNILAIDNSDKEGRVPVDLENRSYHQGLSRNLPSSPPKKTNAEMDIAQNEPKVTWVESKLEKTKKKPSILHVDLDDDDSKQGDDVVVVEQATRTPEHVFAINSHGAGLNDQLFSEVLDKIKSEDCFAYQELFRRIANTRKPMSEDTPDASYRLPTTTQMNKLNEIKLDNELNVDTYQNAPQDQDPIRVSSTDSSDSDDDVKVVSLEPSMTKDGKRNIGELSKNWLLEMDSECNNKLLKNQAKINDARRVSDITSKVNSEQNKTRSVSPETLDDWLAKKDKKCFSTLLNTPEKHNDVEENEAQSYKPDIGGAWLSRLESKNKTSLLKSHEKHNDAPQDSKIVSKVNTGQSEAKLNTTSDFLARLEAEYFSTPTKTQDDFINVRHESTVVPKMITEQNNIRSYLPATLRDWLLELDTKYKTTPQKNQEVARQELNNIPKVNGEDRSLKLDSADEWLADLKSRFNAVPNKNLNDANGKTVIVTELNSNNNVSCSYNPDTARGTLSKSVSQSIAEQPKMQEKLNDSHQEVNRLLKVNSEQNEVRSFNFNTSEDLMSKLGSLYNKSQHEIQEKWRQSLLNPGEIKQVNYGQKHEQFAKTDEESDVEMQSNSDLPILTPEQEKMVDIAFELEPEDEMLVEKFNMRIHRRDLQTLSDLNWLNDEVINFYMYLIMQRSEERIDLPKVYATNTFFYPKFMQDGQAGLRRWTRKVDIFAYDLFMVPVNIGNHWCLSIVDFRERIIKYLDSRGSLNQECLDALLQYLKDEHHDKKGAPLDVSGWKTECVTDIPQQMNCGDCGMFACTFAEFSSRGAAYSFTQAHMPYLRRKAALEILMGKLLL